MWEVIKMHINTLYDIEVPPEPGNTNLWEKLAIFQFIYSLAGLFLGLSAVLGGILLFLNGITGKTSWTAKIIGVESTISDAAPGSVLFIVGLFLVFVTRFKTRIKNSLNDVTQKKKVQEKSNTSTLIPEIKTIVDRAISESSYKQWSSFSGDVEGLRRLREYFGGYFLRLIQLASLLQGESVFEGAKIVNEFFVKTALNHILDADCASYVIKDFILEINLIFEHKGAWIHRIQFAKKWLVKAWSEIDVTEKKYKSFRVDDLKAILYSEV